MYRVAIQKCGLYRVLLESTMLHEVVPSTLATVVDIHVAHNLYSYDDKQCGMIIHIQDTFYGVLYRLDTSQDLYYYQPGTNRNTNMDDYVRNILLVFKIRGGWTVHLVTDWTIPPDNFQHKNLYLCLQHYCRVIMYGDQELSNLDFEEYRV
ncbi:hypothetical protein SNEBB_002542 [Seison nebaliae]|nr:hypothetical protein SNEBB_002542 [Seison nebaliae]